MLHSRVTPGTCGTRVVNATKSLPGAGQANPLAAVAHSLTCAIWKVTIPSLIKMSAEMMFVYSSGNWVLSLCLTAKLFIHPCICHRVHCAIRTVVSERLPQKKFFSISRLHEVSGLIPLWAYMHLTLGCIFAGNSLGGLKTFFLANLLLIGTLDLQYNKFQE